MRKILFIIFALMSYGLVCGALPPPTKPDTLTKPAVYSDMEIFNNVFSSSTNKLSVDASGSVVSVGQASVTVTGIPLVSVRQGSMTITNMPPVTIGSPVSVQQGSFTITNMPPVNDARYNNRISTVSSGILLTNGSVSFSGNMTEFSVYTIGGTSDCFVTSSFNDGIIRIIDGIPFNITPAMPVVNPNISFELPLNCTVYYYITGLK